MLLVPRAEDARLPGDAIKDDVLSCQRSGVGDGGPGAGRMTSNLGDDERFAAVERRGCQFNQRRAIGETFQIAGQDTDALVFQHFAHYFDGRYVRGIARRYEIAKAQSP